MNRGDLQQLANMRLAEAQTLLANGHFAGAYYMAGYAVECALKACIARGVQEFDFPDKKKVEKSWSHNLAQLMDAAGLSGLLASQQTRAAFATNWAIIAGWTESSRYDWSITQAEAQELIIAVGDPTDGVLPWLTTHW